MSPNFLNDAVKFERAANHWANEMLRAQQDSRTSTRVQPWLDCSFRLVSDDSCTDVYSVITETSRRGLRITQWANDAKGKPLDAWIDKFGNPSFPNEIVNYLQVHCKKNRATSIKVRELIKAWLFDEVAIEEMSEFILEILGQPKPEGTGLAK